jgi:hypothetical protein
VPRLSIGKDRSCSNESNAAGRGSHSDFPNPFHSQAWQTASLRYSRLQVCATPLRCQPMSLAYAKRPSQVQPIRAHIAQRMLPSLALYALLQRHSSGALHSPAFTGFRIT